MNKKIEIADKSFWIGYVDDRRVPFHRLILEKGTTYNSYLLMTEKPTIIDTVDIEFGRQYVENLSGIIDLKKIQYIVINHVEPDHAGALPALAAKAPNAVIVATELGAQELKQMFKLHNRQFLIIEDGDTLDIGGKTLKFFETPYLHTEETMITYCVEDKILYPCDQFSTHIAVKEIFNDLAIEDYLEDFKVYYQLIMHPHRPYVQDMLAKIKNLDINMIAPSHGYILRSNAASFIEAYDEMSLPKGDEKKALILFSTMTGNTTKIAKLIGEALEEKVIEHRIINTKNADVEDIKEAIMDADVIFFGTSTRYGDMVGNMEEILKELVAMNTEGKLAVPFGSYGWSGEGIEVVYDYLKAAGMTVVDSSFMIKSTGMNQFQIPIRVKFAPEGEETTRIIQTVAAIGELLLA